MAQESPATVPADVDQPVEMVDPADSSDLTSLSLEDLMNVEVTSVSKQKQKIADAAAAVTVITQEDIQRSGLRQIPEVLRLSPGLFVQQSTHLTHWSVASRGFADVFGNKLLVLQDGRTVYTPFFSGVYWDTVDYPIADLSRIEVIRGPGATLWGSNAVNGVINITSKTAQETQGVLVDSRVGTDMSDLAVRYGGQIDDSTYYRVYAKGRTFGDVPDAVDSNDDWQDTRSGFRIDRLPSDQDTLTLQGDIYYATMSTGGIVPPTPGYKYDHRKGGNVLARWTHVVSDKSDFSLQAYYDRFAQNDSFVDDVTDTLDIDFQHRFEFANIHEIVYGMGARYQANEIHSPTLPQPLVDPNSQDLYILNAFVQDTVTIVPDRFRLIGGSKFEYDSLVGSSLQPNGRAIWTPNEKNTLWASVAGAVRTPNIIEENEHMVLFLPSSADPTQLDEIQVLGNDDLKSETLAAYELGYRHQFSEALSIDVAAFFNSYDRLIADRNHPPQFVTTPFPHALIATSYVNGQDAETYGVELAAKWDVADNWRLAASYSFIEMSVHSDSSDIGFGTAEDGSPQHQFQVHSYLDITRDLSLNASLYYVDSIQYQGQSGLSGSTPAYARVDISVTWKPREGLELSAGVQNAFDPEHPEQSEYVGGSGEVERAVYGQLTWRF